jgi:hypothetical protein
MKRSLIAIITLLLAFVIAGLVEARPFRGGGGGRPGSFRNFNNDGPVKPKDVIPDLVGNIDIANLTFGVIRGKEVTDYTVTKLTRFTINGKTGKFEDLKKGMKVSVVASSSTASRVEAEDYTKPESESKRQQ